MPDLDHASSRAGPTPARPALSPRAPRLSLCAAEDSPCLNCVIANEMPNGFSFKPKSKNFCDLFLLEGQVSDKAVFMAGLRLDTGFWKNRSNFCATIFEKLLQSSSL